MLLLIDNYDSFTYNLAQYFGELGCELLTKRNDEISLDEIADLAPQHICISPGPCTPREAGISKEVVLRFGTEVPILGVCLGHQCIAEAYGGKIVRASRLMHGKSSMIRHNGSALFSDLTTPFEAGRYHSNEALFPGVSRSRPKAMTVKSWHCAIENSKSKECNFIPNQFSPGTATKFSRAFCRVRHTDESAAYSDCGRVLPAREAR